MLQRQRDVLDGLNTAGFITGYRGSPLGGVDQTAWKAKKHLERHHVRFHPGLNEDLAATSVWGTQQVNMFEGAKYDGVFSMWYGKGPGVDRCGDVFKHANAAGTSRHGGVLALAGDDHGAKSSTLPHQSDHIFKACMIPVLYPATVQEYLDLGLHGFAMSRYAGVWVGMKTVTEVVEASASVVVDPQRVDLRDSGRFRDARGRPQHPLARNAARARGATARLQALRGARVLPRQQAQPHGHRFAARALRHRRQRQGVSRYTPGARRISASTNRPVPTSAFACSSAE